MVPQRHLRFVGVGQSVRLVALPTAFAVAISGASCGGDPGPTEPTPTPVTALYIEGDAVLVPGESRALSVFTLRSGEGVRDVTGSIEWSSRQPSVARMSRNVLQAVGPGSATIQARFSDELSAEAAINVVVPAAGPTTDYGGRWEGTFVIAECRRSVGAASNPCRFLQGGTMPWELDVEQQGVRVNGTLILYSGRATGSVRGVVDGNGELLLSGTLRLGSELYSAQIRPWRLSRSGDAITGEGRLDKAQVTVFGPQVQHEVHRPIQGRQR